MLNICKETKRPRLQVIDEAIAFFGEGGVGLAVQEVTSACVSFEGGGGHVVVTICTEDSKREVCVETCEWEAMARSFLGNL